MNKYLGKMGKRVVALLVSFVLLFSFSLSSYAFSYNSAVSITKTNYNALIGLTIDGGLIYENGPENIQSSWLDTAAYGRTIVDVPLTKGKTYELEFYNWNYANTPIRIGFGIKNTLTTDGSITVLKKSILSGSVGSGSTYTNSFDLASNMWMNYLNSSGESSPRICKNNNDIGTSTDQQGGTDILSVQLPNAHMVNGRIAFKVNSEGLYARVFFFKASEYKQKFISWANRWTKSSSDPSDTASGLYENVGRNVSVNNSLSPFGLCKTGQYPNEFESGVNPPSGYSSANFTAGWSLIYSIYGSYPGIKSITITPDYSAQRHIYVVKMNGVWQKVSIPAGGSVTLNFSSGSSFWFINPGGNGGYPDFKFNT